MLVRQLHVPKFGSYEEEAEFWDNLDTADLMEDDDEWFCFETASKRAVRVAILPKTTDRERIDQEPEHGEARE